MYGDNTYYCKGFILHNYDNDQHNRVINDILNNYNDDSEQIMIKSINYKIYNLGSTQEPLNIVNKKYIIFNEEIDGVGITIIQKNTRSIIDYMELLDVSRKLTNRPNGLVEWYFGKQTILY